MLLLFQEKAETINSPAMFPPVMEPPTMDISTMDPLASDPPAIDLVAAIVKVVVQVNTIL